jgi:3-deoxy-D-manno-octulosonate 8-phosphate phosphatase (KDO 8-P phosphatase)
MGNTEKLPIFQEILAHSGLAAEQIAYIGDDLTDAILMKRVGLGVAVANATPEVKAMAHYVTAAAGGSGAVREAAELILEAQGRWEEILRHYEVI